MPTGNNFGASFALDTSDLKAGLAKANRLIREAETEFQQAAASVDDWTQSEELLIKKQQTLNKQIELQQAKVNALVKEKATLIKRLQQEGKTDDEISQATDTLNKQIITQTKQLQKMQGDLTKTNKLLNQWEDNTESLTKVQKSLTEQIEAQIKKIDILSSNKKELINRLNEEAAAQERIKDSINQVTEQINNQSSKMQDLEQQKQNLISKLQEEGKTNDEVQAALSDVNAKIDEQTNKIAALNEQKRKLIEELDSEAKKHQDTKSAIDNVTEQIDNESTKLGDLRNQLTQTNNKLQDFQDSQQDSISALDKLTQEINDQEDELKDLQKRYQSVVLEQGDSSEAAQQLASRIGTLNNALSLNKSKVKDAQTALNRMMDDTSDNVVEVVRLREKIVSQRAELDKLKKAYQESVEQTGKNSKSSRELKKEIDSLTVSLGKNEEAYAKMSRVMELSEELAKQKKIITDLRTENLKWRDTLDGLHNAYWETEDDLKELNEAMTHAQNEYDRTAKELKNAEKAYSDLSDEQKENIKVAQNLVKEADNAEKAQKDLGKAAKESAKDFTVAKGAIATFIGNGLTKLVDAAKNAISSIWNLGESTKEYRTELAKIENVANDVGASTDYIGDKWRDMSSVLGDENAVGEGLNNLMIAGFTAKEQMDEITSYLEGAALKWKDTLKFEGLSDGLQETLATGAAVGQFGEMLERSGVNLDTFNAGLEQCATDAEKQNYVLQELSRLGLAEVSEAYREENKNLIESNKSQKDYQNTLAKFGEIIEPITTKVRNGITQILDKMLELMSDGDIEAFAQKIDESFGKFVDETLPKIIDGIEWIYNNRHLIIDTITAIAAAWAAIKIVTTIATVVNAISTITAALGGVTAVASAASAALAALGGPVTLAIAAAVAGLILIVRHWDDIKAAGVAAWDSIKNAASSAWEWITGLFSKLGSWVTENVVEPLKQIFTPVAEWFGELFSSVWESYKSYIQNVIGFAQGCWESIKVVFGSVNGWFTEKVVLPLQQKFRDLWTPLKDGAKKAWDGIKQTFGTASEWFGNTFGAAWKKVKDVFSSGGKVFDGIKDGIADSFKNITNSLIGGINKIVAKPFDSINSALDKIKNVEILGVTPFKDKIGQISVPQIPLLANGGIVKGATQAIVGERGPEGVFPLTGPQADAWMDKLASKLADKQGSGVVVNQTNNYSQAHSRYELYKTKQDTAAAVRLAMATV